MSAPAGPAQADTIAAAVLAHPSVARLDGGALGVVATHLPGHRVVGVRQPDEDGAVELSVVLTLGQPLPEVTAQLRSVVRAIAGDVRVDVTVTDIVAPGSPEDTEETAVAVEAGSG
ncbi:hypothetical protein [Amycolatopsis sp. H20-H5]|uniref:hypothetical protein n=1 Tax=Amycolatopsis sp. H20-H5 TaxID=3046309 RepID=UPI002DBAB2F1|nr:hypothetical protein [Amycolatopsis sp. H20-H5]MEC3981094.1 hypothetical protein [Amycolatopsis sp. H20-H5]